MDAVSTASDQSDSVKRIRRAILAVFFVVAAVWGALFAKHLHDIQVKHAAASREFERFQAEYSSIMIIGGDAGRLFQHIGAMDREARDAGQKRHDDGESDAPDVTYMYAQAKREYSDVEDMQATLSKMYDQFESLGDEYDNALGHGSASAFKSHLRNANEAWEDGLSNWWRAISDIRDSLKNEASGGYPSADDTSDAHFYEASNENESRAGRYWADAANDLKQLQSRLAQRRASLKRALASS